MEQLTITTKNGANYILFELNGALDSYTLSEFQQKLYNEIQTENVVIDLSKVTAIDYSGIGIIMAAFNDGEDCGNTLYLMTPSDECRKMIESTGFSSVFHIINSITEVI